MESSDARRVLLVIDSSTRRVVSTRPLRPASLDADAMLAEYMAYQQLLVRKTTARVLPTPAVASLTRASHGRR